jgi:hypothetical protein
MKDAVEAEKQGLETIDRHHEEGAKFYTWLKKGDMVLLNVEEDIDVDSLSNKEIGDHLYYLRKTGQSQYGIMLVFALHRAANVDANKDNNPIILRCSPNTFRGIKVEISKTGEVTRV